MRPCTALLVLSATIRCTRVDATSVAIRALMAKHDPILLYVSRLLTPETARDAGALYAWCRRLDELVDDPTLDAETRTSTTRARLEEWQTRFDDLSAGQPRDEMDAELLATLRRHPSLGPQPFQDMLAGMRSDATDERRVATYAELDTYAYQVAGTVGLMLLPLLGVRKESEVNRLRGPAISLGQAIQLINILRDARPDAALGRIYLPQDQMRFLGVAESDVLACKCTPEYRALVERTCTRAESFLSEAESGGRELPGLGPLFVAMVVELYRDYLAELERRGHDNLSVGGERVSISTPRKVLATLRAVRKLVVRSRP